MSPNAQTFAEKMTQTRMDIRLAMRAGLRSTVAHPSASTLLQLRGLTSTTFEPSGAKDTAEARFEERGCVMDPLELKESAIKPEIQIESKDVDESDDTWLNDRVTNWHEPARHLPIHKEQWADDQTLTCWLTL